MEKSKTNKKEPALGLSDGLLLKGKNTLEAAKTVEFLNNKIIAFYFGSERYHEDCDA
jgi:hypothetical protein